MLCPFCGNPDTKVIESKDTENASAIRRRRECIKCGKRFTTYERIELNFRVIKKNGSTQKYSRNKILEGISKAVEKREITQEQIDRILAKIEAHILKEGKEIKTSTIGSIIMRELKKLDKVAYIRFASVYKDFDDIESFKKELKKIS